jgi:hypothetical protein
MKAVFLVPRRNDGGPRDAIWAYCRARWEHYFPDVPVIEGHHDDGPFNRSAAVNAAARLADADGSWDVGIVIDSDVVLSVSQVREAIATAARTGKVTWGHRRWRGIREDITTRLVADRRDLGPEPSRDYLDLVVERTNPISWSCCIAIPRAVWDDLGGFDERFVGWGFEDMAFQSIIVGLYGHERIETVPGTDQPADVIHLWHPRSEERIVKGQGRITASPEYVTNARLGRRYMLAVRRDHGLHDRPERSDAAEMVRDIENLRRDDIAWNDAAQRHGLPDWADWWPTLEELREGAKAHLSGPAPTVTLVMRTGGDPNQWPARSGYIRESLASLTRNVSGPIVQRVLYSDWGPEHRDTLDALASESGFYVVGPKAHLGYTGAMQALWTYLDRRAQGSYVFSVEDDFLYDRPVDLNSMIEALAADRHLVQMALLRGPYYPREIEAGSVLASLKTPVEQRDGYVVHRDHFTANPSLFRRSLVKTPWPSGSSSERLFGDRVLREREARFAYWGDGTPWISHIGAVRASTAY